MLDQNILYHLGFSPYFQNQLEELNQQGWEVGRITSEHKERYSIITQEGYFEGEIIGNLRFSAQSRTDFPVVGDWVLVSYYDEGKVLIHKVFSRRNLLKRQAVGKESDIQAIAANIDYAFIVESVNRDFNINRFERYMTLCYDSGIEPVLILNKSDLLSKEDVNQLVDKIQKRHTSVKLITSNCVNQGGIDEVRTEIKPYKTYCFLGSSGVGKSTIINLLFGEDYLKTNEISEIIQRGKHTTTHRELILLKEGGVLIDNPGLREVGIASASAGVEETFYEIKSLSSKCKYRDCTHQHEEGCAVREAIENGSLDKSSYQNYMRLIKESEHFESSVKERKQKGKALSKRIKQYNKGKKN